MTRSLLRVGASSSLAMSHYFYQTRRGAGGTFKLSPFSRPRSRHFLEGIMKFIAVKKWKDGSETTMEYFGTCVEALAWIRTQKQPKSDEFEWCVGEY